MVRQAHHRQARDFSFETSPFS